MNDFDGGLSSVQAVMDLYDEVEQEIEELKEHEYLTAEYERTYRMLVTQKTAAERMRGTPVTIVNNLVKGDEDVVDAFLKMERARADAKASSHLIFLRKDKMSLLTEVIKHDWYRPSNA